MLSSVATVSPPLGRRHPDARVRRAGHFVTPAVFPGSHLPPSSTRREWHLGMSAQVAGPASCRPLRMSSRVSERCVRLAREGVGLDEVAAGDEAACPPPHASAPLHRRRPYPRLRRLPPRRAHRRRPLPSPLG